MQALKQLYLVSALTHPHTPTRRADRGVSYRVTDQYIANHSELKRPHQADAKDH